MVIIRDALPGVFRQRLRMVFACSRHAKTQLTTIKILHASVSTGLRRSANLEWLRKLKTRSAKGGNLQLCRDTRGDKSKNPGITAASAACAHAHTLTAPTSPLPHSPTPPPTHPHPPTPTCTRTHPHQLGPCAWAANHRPGDSGERRGQSSLTCRPSQSHRIGTKGGW